MGSQVRGRGEGQEIGGKEEEAAGFRAYGKSGHGGEGQAASGPILLIQVVLDSWERQRRRPLGCRLLGHL